MKQGPTGADDAVGAWQRLVAQMEQALRPPVDREKLSSHVPQWSRTASWVSGHAVSFRDAPVAATMDLMLDAQYWAAGPVADDIVRTVGWPLLHAGPAWANGSLDALEATISLRRSVTAPEEQQLHQATCRAVAAAEEARACRDEDLARAHALAAVNLLTHRSRHAHRASSPLVTRTADLIAPIRSTESLANLSDDSTPRPGARFVGRPHDRSPPSVRILTGPYGPFHRDVQQALQEVAQVSVSDLRQTWPELRRRRPIPRDLRLLAALRQGRVDLERGTLDGATPADAAVRRHLRALRQLKVELSHHDVVFSDWGDVGTFWASHLRPRSTRLVTRWHSLDLFDPWLHLLDWRAVDEVLVTNAALAAVLSDLTAGTPAPDPVVVRPYLPDLGRFDRPKSPAAQRTLGMVGWGRVVKDPLFAVDLLDRDPRRRLVLIGPPFAPGGDAATAEYARELTARLATPRLRERVTLVGATDDVAAHLREVGFIVSSSLREGWHTGLLEGVASGAVPVVRDWPMLSSRGAARSMFPEDWVVEDAAAAHRRIAEVTDSGTWAQTATRAKAQVMRLMDAASAGRAYQHLVLGPAWSPAR